MVSVSMVFFFLVCGFASMFFAQRVERAPLVIVFDGLSSVCWIGHVFFYEVSIMSVWYFFIALAFSDG